MAIIVSAANLMLFPMSFSLQFMPTLKKKSWIWPVSLNVVEILHSGIFIKNQYQHPMLPAPSSAIVLYFFKYRQNQPKK